MALSLANASRIVARSLARCHCSSVAPFSRALSTSAVRHDAAASSSYESPFKGEPKSTKVPDFSKYMGGNAGVNQMFGYFMVGTMGTITAAGAKSTIQG
jgi:ubiquinol-cytochrome c reductase iron-sulfur subunit